jgi:hypothetical protein
MTDDQVIIRWAGPGDAAALTALAALESRTLPHVPMLVAERNGSVVAALPVGIGAPALADPFEHTGELVTLLELRAAQLARAERPLHRGRRRLLPALARR